MSNQFLHNVSKFNTPGSLSANFKNRVAEYDRQWRNKDWTTAAHSPYDTFWLYKTADCVASIVDLQREVEKAHGGERYRLPAHRLIVRVAYELANVYRGAWIVEVITSGAMTPDLSGETQALVFDLLAQAEDLYSQNKRKTAVNAELRRELLSITGQLLARYNALIDALPPEVRDETMRSIRARCGRCTDAAPFSLGTSWNEPT